MFAHFDEVKGDNLPNAAAKEQHVLAATLGRWAATAGGSEFNGYHDDRGHRRAVASAPELKRFADIKGQTCHLDPDKEVLRAGGKQRQALSPGGNPSRR